MTATVPPPAKEWQNLLGVCACLGEDFGFNPIFLRIAFGAGLIWSPLLVIAGYLALGAVVLLSRVIVPNRPPAAAVAPQPVANDPQDEAFELPLAA